MVQVIQAPPNFGEQLGAVLGNVAGDVFRGVQQHRAKTALQKLEQEAANGAYVDPFREDYIRRRAYGDKHADATLKLRTQMQKQAVQQQAAQQEKEDFSDIVNKSIDELGKGDVGFFNFYNRAFPKGRQSRAYFDELALGIEKRLATMVGKGALSVPRFEYLKKNLPSSTNTDATNRGKLKALAQEFKVDIKNPEFERAFSETSGQQVASKESWVVSPSGKRVLIPSDQLQAALASGGRLE